MTVDTRSIRKCLPVGCMLFVFFLSSCHVGPDFVRPAVPKTAMYTKTAQSLVSGNGEPSQRLVASKKIPAAWWQLFHSSSLDKIVQQAIANSPTIESARAKLAGAQQSIVIARGAFYPQIDASASVEREKGPPLAFGLLPAINPNAKVPTYNLYSLGSTVNFDPDVFGLTARRVEQQTALAENLAYQLAAAQLTVTGNVVIQALTIASLHLQIRTMEELIADDVKNLALVRKRLLIGTVNRTDLVLAESQLENDRSNLPTLKQQLAAAENALTILVGQLPADWTPPRFELEDFTLPADLPLILPSALVSHRPDILAAEANLHADSAAIGIAVGQLFPVINLSASIAPTSLTLNKLFNSSNLGWDILAGATAPIFHGGTLIAQKNAAIESFRSSVAIYQQTVLEGLRQVSDVLHALSHDAEIIKAQRRLLNNSRTAVVLQRQRFSVGAVDLLSLLDAERSYQQARINYARARAQRYLDSSQLLVALGGGWSRAATCDERTCR